MEASVRAFVSDTPGADYDAIVARFGTPEQITASYLEEMTGEELIGELDLKKKVVAIVTAAGVIAVLLWAGVVFSAWAEHKDSQNGYFVERIIYEGEVKNSSGGE